MNFKTAYHEFHTKRRDVAGLGEMKFNSAPGGSYMYIQSYTLGKNPSQLRHQKEDFVW